MKSSGGKPVLWESMIFGGPLDGDCRRYSSKADALAGHQVLVKKVKVATRRGGD
jgi:hypothetical protein